MVSKKIRTILGQYRFLHELRKFKREPEIVSFDDAKKIGIVYNASDESDSDCVKNYVKNVRSNFKKDILAMGFVDKNKLPAGQYAQFGLDFFTRKDLNFRMIPSNPIVTNFINEPFDILINLNGRSFPLRYITAMSRARFKIGSFTNVGTECFDMMVSIEGDPGIKTVIEEIEHFLRLIRPS